ncbi:MAG: hypothetical protein R3C15_14750 [Thermoleophilia bacterium]
MSAWKLVTTALKARETWQRLPPEQRERLVAGATSTLKSQGPVVAKAAADAARAHGPTVARAAAGAARSHGPTLARAAAGAARATGAGLARALADRLEQRDRQPPSS